MNKNLTLGLCVLALCVALIFIFQGASVPAGNPAITGTPLFLPLLQKDITATPLPTTAGPTAIPTSTPTQTPVPAPASLHITGLNGTGMPEIVTIQNTGGQAQDMTGWSLVSVVGPQTFNFPASFVLAAGASVQLQSYNGAGNNPPAVLFWSSDPIWNNTGDAAELRNNSNVLIDSSCYGNACP